MSDNIIGLRNEAPSVRNFRDGVSHPLTAPVLALTCCAIAIAARSEPAVWCALAGIAACSLSGSV